MQDKKFEIIICICLILISFQVYQLSEKPVQKNTTLIFFSTNAYSAQYENYEWGISNQNIFVTNPSSCICSITAYTNHPKETNSDNHNTATMEKPVVGWSCAVSRDLIHWLGGRIYIEGIGVRYVNDLMNKRFEKSVDLSMGKVKEAKEFGRQEHQVIFLGR